MDENRILRPEMSKGTYKHLMSEYKDFEKRDLKAWQKENVLFNKKRGKMTESQQQTRLQELATVSSAAAARDKLKADGEKPIEKTISKEVRQNARAERRDNNIRQAEVTIAQSDFKSGKISLEQLNERVDGIRGAESGAAARQGRIDLADAEKQERIDARSTRRADSSQTKIGKQNQAHLDNLNKQLGRTKEGSEAHTHITTLIANQRAAMGLEEQQ